MAYLHILGTGKTPSDVANSKGHLFERLIRNLFEHLKMDVLNLDKSENGKEIDIDGITKVGNVKFFAECKAQEDSLDTTALQKFGFKFLTKRNKDSSVRGFLFTLSPLNSKAQEVWDNDIYAEYHDNVKCYRHDEIVSLLLEHYSLSSPEIVRNQASTHYQRDCGDTQLLCIENEKKEPQLFWAQFLMSTDGTEPNNVALYSAKGQLVTEHSTIERLLKQKPDLATSKLSCLNTQIIPNKFDDISPSRSVVRVRMSSGWFDYRFPAAPEYFVGRSTQIAELKGFIKGVMAGNTSVRGFLVSGKSGIGKSSLAIKARHILQQEKVVLLPIDSRLCDDVSFLYDAVNELIAELRLVPELSIKIDNIRVYGLDSLILTLTKIHEIIAQDGYLAVLFFDQFEKVFEYPDVARAIRTLFLRVTEKQLFILFGFAWKSDLWSLAEGFPHNERDGIIREALPINTLTRFGQEETSEILKQLESQWGSKLSILLTRQLADFSRGLPWLLKKVCAHLLDQKAHGVTESELIETNLKLRDLFEADLAGLDDEERSLLRAIAPLLPTTLRRLSESFEISNIDQSLHRFIDKRILVKITEDIGDSLSNVKYDAYSDIFREFLITGNVPLEEAYYFFTYPSAAFSFFEKVREKGSLSIDEELANTGKKMASIYNLTRDLRSLGLINLRNKIFTVTENVASLEQDEIIAFLQVQLKRNRVVSLILAELNENNSVALSHLAELLQDLFPSVQAVEQTWDYYSKTTAHWLHHSQLAFFNKREDKLEKVDDEEMFESALSRGRILTTGYRFPLCYRNSIREYIEKIDSLGGQSTVPGLMNELGLSYQSIEKATSDCLNLKFLEFDEHAKTCKLTELGMVFSKSDEKSRRNIFKQQCLEIPVFNEFVDIVNNSGDMGIKSAQAAKNIIQNKNLDLAELTIEKLGGMLANWAEYGGLITRMGRLCFAKGYVPEQMDLF